MKLTKTSPLFANRDEIPVIDEVGNHCTSCDKVCGSRKRYRIHLDRIHDMKLPTRRHKTLKVNHNSVPDKEEKNNHCTLCNRTYTSKTSYLRHLGEVHHKKTLNIKQDDINEKLDIEMYL